MQLDSRASDDQIKDAARWAAGRSKTAAVSRPYKHRREVLPTNYNLLEQLGNIAFEYGITPPQARTEAGIVARMTCNQWWTRKLRTATLRENETIEHAAGLIRKKGQCYVSDHATKVKAERAKANRQTLENLEVCNESGEAYNLQEIADKSVSNPALRRAELMTRCRGFEEAAQFMGHTGYFLTLTCPSRFHRVNYHGIGNKKWVGNTPKDAQQYLCKVWAKIRSAWKKKGFTPYGFRVAEPHHDACPHWHILLFFPQDQARPILGIASAYALQDNPTESGAQKRRFTVKRIDPSQGSATGYIAKYICKNIDGTQADGAAMGLDFASGTDAAAAARRVRDWASLWGIRQFQQIGGPSVTVWRELRRLGKDAEALQLELFEKPRAAASRGEWFDFWMVQGGPEVARKDLTLKPFYVADDLGKYGDETQKVKGVHGHDATGEYVELTRLETWTVQRAGTADNDAAAWNWANERANAGFFAAYRDSEFKRIGEAERTRTGVNNCSENRFDFSSFDATDPNETAHLYQMGDQADPMTAFQDVWKDEKDNERHAAAWERFVKPTTGRPLDPHYSHLLNPTH